MSPLPLPPPPRTPRPSCDRLRTNGRRSRRLLPAAAVLLLVSAAVVAGRRFFEWDGADRYGLELLEALPLRSDEAPDRAQLERDRRALDDLMARYRADTDVPDPELLKAQEALRGVAELRLRALDAEEHAAAPSVDASLGEQIAALRLLAERHLEAVRARQISGSWFFRR